MHGATLFQALLFLIGSQWSLSMLDASGKTLAMAGVSILAIAWVRYVVHAALSLSLTLPRQGRRVFKTQRPWLQALRGVLILLSTLLFFTVLSIAPLAEGTAMNFLAPILVMALAPWLLKERASASRWIAVAVAFAGMLIVVRPSGALPIEATLLGLACAVCFACFQLVTRSLRAEPPMTTNLYSALVGATVCSVAIIFIPVQWPREPWLWALLVSTGLTGFLGHLLQINAYMRAPASVLSPFIYLQILSATTLGWFAFKQVPDATTFLGIGLIMAAGAFTAWRERSASALQAPAD
jgi:drug/metabolite transporter (DMT)-like permease